MTNLFWNQSPSERAKNSEMGNIGLVASLSLIKHFSLKTNCHNKRSNVDSIEEHLSPIIEIYTSRI